MSRHIEYDLKNEIYSKYQRLDQTFYKRNDTGDLMNRISEDVGRVRMYLGPGIMYTINLVILFVLVIMQMTAVNPELTLYILAPMPLMCYLIYKISSKINKKSELVQEQQSRITTNAQETFSGIRIFKSYNAVNRANQFYNSNADDYKQKQIELIKTEAYFIPSISLLVGISTILTVWIGGIQCSQGKVSIGNIAEFVMYVNMLTWPFASVGWISSLIQRAAVSQKRINHFLKEPENNGSGNLRNANINGDIVIKNLSFIYPGTGIQAINNLNLVIPKGKSIGIIGKTGSGKSTLAALLTKQYESFSGEITINNFPIKNIEKEYLRRKIGYVPQDVFLFSDTIKNNILFGLETFTDESKVKEVAKIACVDSDISQFPKGYNTIIGERGITLSGGQKQRISIARAIIKKPEFLILDDCLSAIDTETEKEIKNNLLNYSCGTTTIIISHRISFVKSADLIAYMHKGQIIEWGTHQELMAKKANYHELHLLQGAEIQ